MKSKRNKRIVIAIDLAHTDGQRKLTGILHYLKSHRIRWDIRLKRRMSHCRPSDVDNLTEQGIDGVIFSLPSPSVNPESAETLKRIAHLPIPLVVIEQDGVLGEKDRGENIAFISRDVSYLGKTAAEYFLEQGIYKSYGFFGRQPCVRWNMQRAVDFRNALRAKGADADIFRASSPNGNYYGELCRWLKKLPKPAAVLVAFDDIALTVLEACASAKLNIPADVSVLSIDDDALICENCIPKLSSMHTDQERTGRLAAEMMTRLLRTPGLRLSEKLTNVAITHRDTTMAASQYGKLVKRAMDYIGANAGKRISADDVADRLNVSRQLLDLRFRQVLASTVSKKITEIRLANVATMLTNTSLSIKEIAAACDFSDSFHLMHSFRRRYGLTMNQYRAVETMEKKIRRTF